GDSRTGSSVSRFAVAFRGQDRYCRRNLRRTPAMPPPPTFVQHPVLDRRTVLQAGTIGLLGLSMGHLRALRAAHTSGETAARSSPARAVIYIFLSGGLSQLDSFDLKPDAPENIRGEFRPIATRTPGVRICEHLPLLAQRSHLWSLVRSLTHPSNDHSAGHAIMLSGRSQVAPGFNPSLPRPTDWPSIAAVAGDALPPRNNLPPPRRHPARKAGPHHRPRHPRAVRRHHGCPARPVVHRGMSLRPARLRRLSRVRVRPPGTAAHGESTRLPGAEHHPAGGGQPRP